MNRFPVILTLLLLIQPLWSQLLVDRVEITGNTAFPDREISALLQTRPGESFSQAIANEDCKRIMQFYREKGYYNVRIDYPVIETTAARTVNVTFIVHELGAVILDSLQFSGNRTISQSRLSSLLGGDTNRRIDDIPMLVRDIVDIYADRGFLFASVELDSIAASGGGYTGYLSVDEGPLCRFTRYRYEGNDVTTPATLRKITRIDKADIMTLPLLRRMEEVLRRKEYIAECDLVPQSGNSLLFRIREDRMTRVSGIAGYDNRDDGGTITGFVLLEFLNLFGTDRALRLDWRRFTRDHSSIEFRYHDSGPVWPTIAGNLRLFREEADSTLIHSAIDVEPYWYSLYHRVGLLFGLDDYQPGIRKENAIEAVSVSKFGAMWAFNDVDYEANPRSGSDVSIRTYAMLQRDEDGETTNQATELSLWHYLPVWRHWIAAVRLEGKQAGKKRLKSFQYYNLGGSRSLRGFRENQFQGYRTGLATVEMRYLISRRSRFSLFADWGLVHFVDGEVQTELNDLFGFGFGLRIQTRLGLLGIDYAFGYGEGEWRSPLDGIIHFGFEAGL